MVNKIKNKTAVAIDFGTFNLDANETAILNWTKPVMTGEAFGKMMAIFDSGDIEFLDENDALIDQTIDRSHYTLDANGNISAQPVVIQVPAVRKQLITQFTAI